MRDQSFNFNCPEWKIAVGKPNFISKNTTMTENRQLDVFSNLLKLEDILICEKILRGPGWFFGFKSDVPETSVSAEQENIPFWKLPLDNEPFFTNHFFNIIKSRTGKDFELLEVYCNGQTYGQDGHPHIDCVWGETHTFLYYATQNWNLTWGGQTIFLIDSQKVGIDPRPNNGILFTTNLMHYGEAYNQFCRDLRMTVCYKLKEIIK